MALGFEKMKASTWKGALPFSKYSAKREVCALVELDLKIIPKNSILPFICIFHEFINFKQGL